MQMKNNHVIWFWLSGTVFVIISTRVQVWSNIEKSAPAQCTTSYTGSGLNIVNCSLAAMGTLVDSMPNVKSGVNILDLSDQANLKIIDASLFDKHQKTLQQIILHGHQYVKRQSDSNFQKELFGNIVNLDYLKFTSSSLDSDAHQWVLPQNITTYIIDNNGYTILDFKPYLKLKIVSINYNRLNDLPPLSTPAPPITSLQLKGNPLTEFTVEDIADLCDLVDLKLEFTKDFFLGTTDGYCECKKFENWTQLQDIQGTTYSCSTTTKVCPDNPLQKALDKHRGCSPKPKISLKWVLIAFLGVVLFFAFVSFTCIKLLERSMSGKRSTDAFEVEDTYSYDDY